jgi:phenylalanyl-tRNA synthetase beta chain
MKISYNWLKQYLSVGLPTEKISELLTFSGLEVEGFEKFQSVEGGLEGLVIGEVRSKEKHPDADRLSITTVDTGEAELLNIVCGASNVDVGQKVVVATVGATLYPSSGEPFQIKKSKIRGAASEGMICAEDEIGMGTSHEGIMVLSPDAKVGAPAAEYFNIETDTVFEIGLTPNRADAASHIGVARDLAAVVNVQERKNTKVSLPDVSSFKEGDNSYKIDIEVQDSEACPRYSGLTIKNIKVAPSPQWLQNRLKSIGVKSINNIVDITNYILHELGQPLHAFDADKIRGKKVVVRKAQQDRKFITLDKIERTLGTQDLMICNTEGPMCIAGVFGGIESGVTESTKNIFLESAYFNPVSIRKTSKHHGLKTDASFRYERGTDPNITVYALKRAAMLITEIAGGEVSSEIIDIYPEKVKDFEIFLSYRNCDRLIGKSIDRETIKSILESLEIKIQEEIQEGLQLLVPPFKVDVTREVDVIEEILRIYGYNNIEMPSSLMSSLTFFTRPDKEKVQNIVSDLLVGNGFSEMMTNSLGKSEHADLIGEQVKESIMILNPLSNDLNAMRQTLLFSGLEAINYNVNRKSEDLKLFEFGKLYWKDSSQEWKYKEEQHLSVFTTGAKFPENWNTGKEQTDFYYLKGVVLGILSRLGLDFSTKETENSSLQFGLVHEVNGKQICEYGPLRKKILKAFDIDQEVFYADFNWSVILKLLRKKKEVQYKEIPKYPAVRRDLALLLDKKAKFAEIEQLAYQNERHLLKKVNLFDVYEGEKLEAGKKSYAVGFVLQDTTKTLTDNQVDKIMEKLLIAFEEKLGARLR